MQDPLDAMTKYLNVKVHDQSDSDSRQGQIRRDLSDVNWEDCGDRLDLDEQYVVDDDVDDVGRPGPNLR